MDKEGMSRKGVFKGNGIPNWNGIIFIDQMGNSPVSCAVKGGHIHLTNQEIDSIKLDGTEIAVSELLVPEKPLCLGSLKSQSKEMTVVLNCSPVRKCSKELMSIPDYLVMNDFEFAYYAKLQRELESR